MTEIAWQLQSTFKFKQKTSIHLRIRDNTKQQQETSLNQTIFLLTTSLSSVKCMLVIKHHLIKYSIDWNADSLQGLSLKKVKALKVEWSHRTRTKRQRERHLVMNRMCRSQTDTRSWFQKKKKTETRI